MAYFKNFDFVPDTNSVGYRESQGERVEALAPSNGITVALPLIPGLVEITVSGLDHKNPKTIKRKTGKPPKDPNVDPFIELFNHVPMLVELFPPGQSNPVATFHTESEPTEQDESTFSHLAGALRRHCRVR